MPLASLPIPRFLRSLRLAILLPAVVLNLVAGLGVAYLALGNARDSVSELSLALHDQIARRVAERLDTFLSPPPQLLRSYATLADSQGLPLHDMAALRRFFTAEIQNHHELSSQYLAFPLGGMIGAGMDREKLYVTGTDTPAAGQWRKSWADGQGDPIEVVTTLPNFDARLRPWFKAAIDDHDSRVVWSDVYVLFSGQDMALTASKAIRDDHGQVRAVIAADIFLSHISDFLRRLHRQQPGLTFIVDAQGLLVASSTDEAPFQPATATLAARRLAARDAANPVIAQAAAGLAQSTGSHFTVSENGNRHSVTAIPFTESHGLSWQVLVVVPESAYLGHIQAGSRLTALLIAAVVLASLLLGFALAYAASRAITAISRGARAISNGQLSHKVPIPALTELADLATAFNGMADKLAQADRTQKHHIAEMSQAQSLLKRQNQALETSNAELEYFAYVASHDLREPLRNVTAYASLLGKRLDGRLSPEEQDFLAFIHQGGLRMDELVRDLLDFARIGRQGDPMADIAMTDALEMAKANLRVQLEQAHAQVETITALPVVSGCVRELVSLLQNLIANALKYRRPDVPPRITLSCQPEPGQWHFQVADNGIGLVLGQGYEERVFRLFQRLHQRDEHGGGTGVGLAICKRVAEGHGGDIWVVSPGPNQGCVFHFTLPMAEIDD